MDAAVRPMGEGTPFAAQKAALRAEIREHRRAARRAMSEADWQARAARIAEAVCAHEAVRRATSAGQTVAAYEALETEPPTAALIARLREEGIGVLLPRVQPHRSLAWGFPDQPDSATVPGSDGLLHHDCGVVITPALAVGRDFSRLGQGGGYFDRLIVEARAGAGAGPGADLGAGPGRPVFLALVGSDELTDSVPTAEFDQPIDGWILG